MEPTRCDPPIRILLVGLPLWLGETITEEYNAATELTSIPTNAVSEFAARVQGRDFDLVIAELTTALPKLLRGVGPASEWTPVLGIGEKHALLYEGAGRAVDLGDRPLPEVVARSREVVIALRTQRRS